MAACLGVTLLICHSETIHDVNDSNLCAEVMLQARTADQIRATEGIARGAVYHRTEPFSLDAGNGEYLIGFDCLS